MLAGLLALTGVMLVSGFLRLKLYVDAYGLTWLRILSAWFVIYLAAVLILCFFRMAKEKLEIQLLVFFKKQPCSVTDIPLRQHHGQ